MKREFFPYAWRVAGEREADYRSGRSDDDLIPLDSRQSSPIPLMSSRGRTTPAYLAQVRHWIALDCT